MHANISALLDLHRVNEQRQRLVRDRQERERRLAAAHKALAAVAAQASEAQGEVDRNDALVRQYTADIERCETTINDLRSRQMEAKTNKEYLAIINGVENAKAERALREESLKNLGEQIDALKATAAAATARRDQVAAKVAEVEAEATGTSEAAASEAELERIYQDKRARVDAKFLEHYERLIQARHRMPLVPVDPASRATPFGNIVSHNQCEQLRLGQFVVDAASNGILYLKEEARSAEGEEVDGTLRGGDANA